MYGVLCFCLQILMGLSSSHQFFASNRGASTLGVPQPGVKYLIEVVEEKMKELAQSHLFCWHDNHCN